MSAAPKPLRLFIVQIRRADGTASIRLVVGGNAVDHTTSAIDEAGPEGSVRVSYIKPHTGATA